MIHRFFNPNQPPFLNFSFSFSLSFFTPSTSPHPPIRTQSFFFCQRQRQFFNFFILQPFSSLCFLLWTYSPLFFKARYPTFIFASTACPKWPPSPLKHLVLQYNIFNNNFTTEQTASLTGLPFQHTLHQTTYTFQRFYPLQTILTTLRFIQQTFQYGFPNFHPQND